MKDETDEELDRLGYMPDYPPETIRGVALNPDQYDNYVRMAGKLSKASLDGYIKNPGWSVLSDAEKLALVRKTIAHARDMAQTAVMSSSLGSENDIVKKATDAKAARLESFVSTPEQNEPAPEAA